MGQHKSRDRRTVALQLIASYFGLLAKEFGRIEPIRCLEPRDLTGKGS